MKYAILIFENAEQVQGLRPEQFEECMREHRALRADLGPGRLVSTAALHDVTTAQSVLSSETSRTVMDGPFAETKEVLMGFYVCEFDSLDDAISFGKKIPILDEGTVEIRPVLWVDPDMHCDQSADV